MKLGGVFDNVYEIQCLAILNKYLLKNREDKELQEEKEGKSGFDNSGPMFITRNHDSPLLWLFRRVPNCPNGKKIFLELDLYSEKYGLALEFQGPYHFIRSPFGKIITYGEAVIRKYATPTKYKSNKKWKKYSDDDIVQTKIINSMAAPYDEFGISKGITDNSIRNDLLKPKLCMYNNVKLIIVNGFILDETKDLYKKADDANIEHQIIIYLQKFELLDIQKVDTVKFPLLTDREISTFKTNYLAEEESVKANVDGLGYYDKKEKRNAINRERDIDKHKRCFDKHQQDVAKENAKNLKTVLDDIKSMVSVDDSQNQPRDTLRFPPRALWVPPQDFEYPQPYPPTHQLYQPYPPTYHPDQYSDPYQPYPDQYQQPLQQPLQQPYQYQYPEQHLYSGQYSGQYPDQQLYSGQYPGQYPQPYPQPHHPDQYPHQYGGNPDDVKAAKKLQKENLEASKFYGSR